MARRGGRNGRSSSSSSNSSTNLNKDFWSSFGASNPNGTTPSTSSTPTGRHRKTPYTGTHAKPRIERETRYSDFIAGRSGIGRRGIPTTGNGVNGQLEAAYEGDDSELLSYRPTSTTDPSRPRTLAAGYDRQNQTLYVRFRDGDGYEYHDVTQSQWREFKTTPSPGKYINSELNHHDYNRADW
jgi:KTSC domain